MAIDLGNGFVVSDSVVTGKHKTTDAERASAVLNQYGGLQGIANSGMSLTKLLEALSGAKWNIPLFDNITAGQAISAYQKGTLPSTGDAKKAIQSGEYNGTVQDYMNENIAKATGVEYTKGSGNQTLDDLNNAVGAVPSGSSSGTDYLDQLTAIQNSGNAPSANMEGWADSFINKLGKAQSGGDSKEDAFNKMWANYAEGNPDHASPELQAVLRQMAGLDGGDSGSGDVDTGSDYVSMPSNSVETALWKAPFTGGTVEKLPGTLTTPSYELLGSGASSFGTSGGGSSSSGTGGTFPGTFPNTSGSGVGSGASGGANDAFAQYLANVTDSAYNKQMSGSIADLESLYKELFGNIQGGDYTKKPYYQTILESYGLAGDAAADNAVAGIAGSNGGNLDSYAAANAKRQQLAYKNAAQGAALDAYNAEIGNLIKTLGDMGVNVNDLYATWAQNLASERGTAADVLLGQLGIDRDKYVTDAQAAVDKYLGELGLEGTKVQADADKYLGQLGAETDRYLGELSTNLGMSQIEADKYLGDLNANLGMSQIEADKQMNADTLAAQREIARMESELQTKLARIESASETERQRLITEASIIVAQIEDANKRYGYELDAETQKAKAKLQAQADKYGYDTQYNLGLYESMNSATKETVEASSTEKQKALAIRREDGEAAYNEYLASLPEEKRQSVSSYVDQYFKADSASLAPSKSLDIIASAVGAEMASGTSFEDALERRWAAFIASNPQYNTPENFDNALSYIASKVGYNG